MKDLTEELYYNVKVVYICREREYRLVIQLQVKSELWIEYLSTKRN